MINLISPRQAVMIEFPENNECNGVKRC